MERIEQRIRDNLCSMLEIIEPGLVFLDKEKYLPNPIGTRSFIDIFARDKNNKYVLIELKRSKSSSRDALHQVLKYLEGVKENISLRDDEVRLIVISTEWSELLVPFSSFVNRIKCSVQGFNLVVDENNVPINTSIVEPLKLLNDRLFAPWHELNLYETKENMLFALKAYEDSCAQKRIFDYVIVIMTPPDGFHEASVIATFKNMESIYENSDDNPHTLESLRAHMSEYKYILYFATLELNETDCLDVIQKLAESDDREEFMDYILDMEGDERLGTLHEKVYEIEPSPPNDYYEIGYPAKFGTKLLNDEGWHVEKINRYGTLAQNELLTDELIIEELSGSQGNTGQRYIYEFSLNNNSCFEVMRKGVKSCLKDNPIWRNQILLCIDELQDSGKQGTGRISVFNPSNFCLALFLALTRDNGFLYIPNYHITTTTNNKTEMIFGAVVPTDKQPSFTSVLSDFYDDDAFCFLMSLQWGGYESRDANIMRDIGATYKTYKCIDADDKNIFFELTELGWEECNQIELLGGFEEYIARNKDFVDDVCGFYACHWDGAITHCDRDEKLIFKT